jgi:hypothetical protein
VSAGNLLEFSVGKQNAGKQRTCEVSLGDMEKMVELENAVWRTNLAAPKKGKILLQEVGSGE